LLAVKSPSGTYNIGTGTATSIADLAALSARLQGHDIAIQHGPPVTGEVRDSVLDAGLAGEQLGWRPLWSLEDGIRETLLWYERQMGHNPHV
jgi:UDP-glucose 4-epimerase